MKNKHKKLLFVPLFLLLVAGCTPPAVSDTPPTVESSDTSVVPESSSVEESISKTGPGYEGTENYALATTPNPSNRELDHAIDMTALSSIGEQKVLVVPVVFTDTTEKATPEVHTMINKVFFGQTEETGWESVASFYHKSSFGKLTLGGEVLPYFNAPYSTVEFGALEVSPTQQIGPGNYWDQTHHLIEDIYETMDAAKLKEYDQDSDGHVDAFWMVYIADIKALGTGNDPFWAYKFYWNRVADVEKPTPNVYAWASYKFALEGSDFSAELPDAHTFIHETGHVLSLPDYYDYDGKTAPAGGIDMMDHNIIDHNIYSKYRLNWATPYYVTGHSEITLKPSQSSGEFILIKDGWNGHVYDEYLIIEYYTPTGLNKRDSGILGYLTNSSSQSSRGFTVPGVRMYHVDSRLITKTFSETEPHDLVSTVWSDEITYDEWSYTAIGPSNTTSRSTSETEKLLHLINAQGKRSVTGNWLKERTNAFDEALFQPGAKIDATNWARYLQFSELFNDGTPVGYSVEIGEMNAEGVKISITKY